MLNFPLREYRAWPLLQDRGGVAWTPFNEMWAGPGWFNFDGRFLDSSWSVEVRVTPEEPALYDQLDVRLDVLALAREAMREVPNSEAVAALLEAYPTRLDVVTLLGETCRFVAELCEAHGIDRDALAGASANMIEDVDP